MNLENTWNRGRSGCEVSGFGGQAAIVFQHIDALHPDFSVEADDQADGDIEVGLGVADAGREDESACRDGVIDQAFEEAVLEEAGIEQRGEVVFGKGAVQDDAASGGDAQADAVVDELLPFFVLHHGQGLVGRAEHAGLIRPSAVLDVVGHVGQGHPFGGQPWRIGLHHHVQPVVGRFGLGFGRTGRAHAHGQQAQR